MFKSKETTFVAACCGFLSTTFLLALGIRLNPGETTGVQFLWLSAVLFIPFLVSFLVVAKLVQPEIMKAQSPLRAAKAGIWAALSVALLVVVFTGIGIVVFTLLQGEAHWDLDSLVGGGLLFLLGAHFWAFIPAVLCGGFLGLCTYFQTQSSKKLMQVFL